MTDKIASARRLGLLGGTFDPVHYGHLLIAEEACQQFELDAVVFVPNGQPAHKQGAKVSSPTERAAMCETAIADNDKFVCSRIEIEREGLSYSIDTVQEFRARYPALDALYFITGADAVLELGTWHRAADLVRQCEFIAATRPGSDLSHIADEIGPELAKHVHFMPIPGIDISSTDLRRRAADGGSVRYLTPDSVAEYMRRHSLYIA